MHFKKNNLLTWTKLQRKIKSVNYRLEDTICRFDRNRLLRKLKMLIKRLFSLNRKWRLGIATTTLLLWLGNNNINAQTVLDHTKLNGSNGFKIVNSEPNGVLGYDISDAGDFNGDGINDMVISSHDSFLWGFPNNGSGAVYVIFGSKEAFQSEIDVATLNGSNGIVIKDNSEGDGTGISVSTAGDFNNDGFDDLLIGEDTQNGPPTNSKVYVLFGNDLEKPELNLGNIDGTDGIMFSPDTLANDFGKTVSYLGDINNDGFDDIAASRSIDEATGKVYIIYGSDSDYKIVNSIDTLISENKITVITSEKHNGANNFAGSISDALSGGDVNGDGFIDIVIGDYFFDKNGKDAAGAVYIVFGNNEKLPHIKVDTLDGQNGFTLVGYEYYGTLGNTIDVSDINGDGFDDIICGNYAFDTEQPGKVTVLFGKNTGFNSIVEASEINGTDGFEIIGLDADMPNGRYSYVKVNSIDDVNGDGLNDILIGIDQKSENGISEAGQVIVLYGKENGWPADYNMHALNDTSGFVINGTHTGEEIGFSIAGVGDINGDGTGDFAFAGKNGEEAFVVFGEEPIEQVNFTDLNSSDGFTVVADRMLSSYGDQEIGDLNGDGIDDLVVSSPGKDAFLVFGTDSPQASTLDANTLDGSNGFKITSSEEIFNVALVDINGDGFDDLSVGQPYFNGNKGQIHTVFGHDNTQEAIIDLENLQEDESQYIYSDFDSDQLGYYLFNGGDINGDGLDDLVNFSYYDGTEGHVIFANSNIADTLKIDDGITADVGFHLDIGGVQLLKGDFNNDGKSDFVTKHGHVRAIAVLGQNTVVNDTIHWDELDGTNGYEIELWASYEDTKEIDGVLDFNNDGYDDLLIRNITKPYYGVVGNDTLHVVYGHAGPFPDLNLDQFSDPNSNPLDGNNGRYITGLPTGESFSTVTILDFNKDGADDVVIENNISNEVYLAYGTNDGETTTDVSNLQASEGFKITGFDNKIAVHRGGDLNGDGYDDLIIMDSVQVDGTDKVVAHIIHGQNATNTVYSVSDLQGNGGFDLVFNESIDYSYDPNQRALAFEISNPDFNGDSFEDVLFTIHKANSSSYKFLLSDACAQIRTEQNVALCSGESYTYPDGTIESNITENTSHISNLISQVTGCDSLVATNITINEVYDLTEDVTVCMFGNYTFPDGTSIEGIMENSTHVSNLLSKVTGCDSIITTNLTVIEEIFMEEEVQVCPGENYTYPDGTVEENITEDKIYFSTLKSTMTACDSSITTIIKVHEISETQNDVEVCSGSDYTYPDGTTESNITANNSHISHLVSQVTGCDSIVTTNIQVNTIDLSVSVDGNILIANEANADSYQWVDCDLNFSHLVGSVEKQFTATKAGNYAVIIESNGCIETSDCNSIIITGIEDVESVVQSIWPNPTSGQINIQLGENNTPVVVSIFDLTGKIISQNEVAISETIFTTQIPGKSGLYFIQLRSNTKTVTYKIIKK